MPFGLRHKQKIVDIDIRGRQRRAGNRSAIKSLLSGGPIVAGPPWGQTGCWRRGRCRFETMREA